MDFYLLPITEPNIFTTQGQKWQNTIKSGREPQVRGYRWAAEQRDQEKKEMDGTSTQSAVRLHCTTKYAI